MEDWMKEQIITTADELKKALSNSDAREQNLPIKMQTNANNAAKP